METEYLTVISAEGTDDFFSFFSFMLFSLAYNIPFQDGDMVSSPHILPSGGQAPPCGHKVH